MSAETTPNPFAPTPLGKDWTPPGERRDAHVGTGDEQVDVPLDDLFESSPEAAPAEATAEAPTEDAVTGDTGLDDLFDPVPQTGEKVETGGGLDDLFEVDGPGTAAPSSNAAAPVVKPRVRRRGVPAALRAKNRVVASDEDAPVQDDAHAAGQGDRHGDKHGAGGRVTERRPLPPAPQRRYTETTESGTLTPATDARQTGTEAASVAPSASSLTDAAPVGTPPIQTPTPTPGRRSLFAYGAAEIDRAWTIVDQTLAIVGSDISLQQVTSGITLTADPVEYAAQRGELHAALRRKMASAGIAPSGLIDSETILDLVVDEMSGISVLGELFRDPSIDEILVDRWDIVSVERRGNLERTSVRFRDPQHAESCARALALKISDRAVSRAIPLVTAELPSARITFAFGAVVKGGLSITIRKFRPLLGLEDLLNYGSLNRDMVEFLREAVTARAGILVSGGTGTGKTTIVNLLSSFIPDTERVVSIEDAFELKLANTHVVSLQTKEASSLDDTVSVTLAELLRNTLRMRPDRIIVGEIREGAGAMVMLSAASTGHDGTLTTVHANSAEAAVNERLPDLVRQSRGGLETETILRSVANAFDLVIQVSRTRDGRRYLSQISVLDGIEDGRIRLQPVFIGTETTKGIRFERREFGADTELARRLADRRANGEEA